MLGMNRMSCGDKGLVIFKSYVKSCHPYGVLLDGLDSHIPIIMSPLRGYGDRRNLHLSIIISPLRGWRAERD